MDYIVHYGIKGQQHGKRRFQNEDGSLTPAGRERYLNYVDRSNRIHFDDDNEEDSDSVRDDSTNKRKKEKSRKTGGHQIKGKSKSFKELVNEEGYRRREKIARKKVEAAMKAMDKLNETAVRGDQLKRKKYGEQNRFNTGRLANKTPYSLAEYEKYIKSGKNYFKRSDG